MHARVWLLLPVLALVVALGSRAAPGSAATIIYVNFNANGADDGTSWANAFPDLITGLAGAQAGDQVWVARGVYRPSSMNLRGASFFLESGVEVYGGFGGFETSLDRRNPDLYVTTLSGNLGLQEDATDNSYHVVRSGLADATARLDGFRIIGGFANGGGAADVGGGVYLESAATLVDLEIAGNYAIEGGGLYANAGDAVIRDALVRSNTADDHGGGMYINEGSPSITDSTFAGNTAGIRGGGANVYDGGASFTRVTFTANRSVGSGGGLYSTLGSPAITDSTFAGNTAQNGGGLFDNSGSPDIRNSTFAGNTADGIGGGLYFADSTAASVRNVTITGNAADDGAGILNNSAILTVTNATITRNFANGEGGGIDNASGTTTLRDSIIWDNKPDQLNEGALPDDMVAENNLVQGGCPDEIGCTGTTLTANPILGPLADNGGPTKTHALGNGSAAIDVGTAAICTANPKDQRGITRPADGDKNGTKACDFGAYESVPAPPVAGFTTGTSNGDESDTSVTIQVKLSTTAVVPVTVKYKSEGGTAKSPSDFAAAAGTLTFPALTTTRNITLTVKSDAFKEPNETVVLSLLSATGATLSPAKDTHVYTITNDDPRTVCRGRVPTIIGTAGNDTIAGTNAPDIIAALGGNDTITGGRADDLICGGTGNDTIEGGPGNDTLRGEAGDDTLKGDAGIDVLFGAIGSDRLAGGPTTGDSCNGGPGVDTLLPAAGCESTAGIP